MHEGYQDTFEKINKPEKRNSPFENLSVFLYNEYYVELIWPSSLFIYDVGRLECTRALIHPLSC